jgi:peptide/nickel transport system permease protein
MKAKPRTGGTADHAVTDAPWFWVDSRAAFGLSVYLLLVLLAMFAPVVSTGDPAVQRDVVATRFLPPLSTDLHGVFHLVGTDRFGRDVWTRLVYGSRISLSVGILAMVVSVTIGVFVGAMAGLRRGAVRATLLGLTDFALALPRVVLLLLLAALWQPSALLVVVVLGVTGWMPITRLVYGEVRGLSARPFVHAAEALGVRRSAILSRHVLPNAMTPVIVAATLGVGNAIMLEAGLSFLGVGVQPPMPSWGNMIASGRDTLVNATWVATAPGLLLVLVVVASTLLGDALRDTLEPSKRAER